MKAKLIGGAAVAAVLALSATLVKPWEGYSATPYKDIVGVVTVCYGSTNGVQNKTYTLEECEATLHTELGQYLVGAANCIGKPLTENEWAAVLSWTYNVGVSAACKSTLIRQINRGEPASVWCYELRRWVYVKGRKKPVRGLANRREAELAMCLGNSQVSP
jgi:lysozyme